MGNENTVRKAQRAGTNRKKLSEITNTPFRSRENIGVSIEAQLQKEVSSLKQLLQEKEESIDKSKHHIEKLLLKYCQKTKQNDEIILHNAQVFKELMQTRDKLKVLQHENTQMAAVHKAYKMEMEKKLADAMGKVNHLSGVLRLHSHREVVRPDDIEEDTTFGPHCESSSTATSNINVMKREGKSSNQKSSRPKIRQKDGASSKTSRKFVSSQCETTAPKFKQVENHVPHGIINLKESIISEDTLNSDATAGIEDQVITERSSDRGMNLKANAGIEDQVITDQSSDRDMNLKDNICKVTSSSESEVNGTRAKNLNKRGQCELSVAETEDLLQRFDWLTVSSTKRQSVRPQRRAVSSIGSYREPALNIKMRRPS